MPDLARPVSPGTQQGTGQPVVMKRGHIVAIVGEDVIHRGRLGEIVSVQPDIDWVCVSVLKAGCRVEMEVWYAAQELDELCCETVRLAGARVPGLARTAQHQV